MNSNTSHYQPLILVANCPSSELEQLQRLLQQENYRVLHLSTLDAVLSSALQLQPDLVLLGASEVGEQTLNLVTALKALPNLQIPALVLVDELNYRAIDRLFAVKGADFVTRPIYWTVLRQRICTLLQNSQLQRELAIARDTIESLICIDRLTQVSNQRHFNQQLHQEWRRMERDQRPLGLVLCEVDYFEAYKAIQGQAAADECLQQVAKIATAIMKRPADLVGRYGDQKFAILLPNTSTEGALHVAYDICEGVRSLKLPHLSSKAGAYVTVSVGITSAIPCPEFTLECLATAADVALDRAQSKGHDCVVMEPVLRFAIREDYPLEVC